MLEITIAQPFANYSKEECLCFKAIITMRGIILPI